MRLFFFNGRRSSLWEIRGIGSITKVLFQYVPNQSTFRSYRAEHSGMERFQLVGQIGRVPFKLFICVKICTLVTNVKNIRNSNKSLQRNNYSINSFINDRNKYSHVVEIFKSDPAWKAGLHERQCCDHTK